MIVTAYSSCTTETNEAFAFRIIQELYVQGVQEWVLCSGKRNAPLFAILLEQSKIKTSFWFDERSAAFFALGRSRALKAPVALLTTSGTAAAEPLPAIMEAFYTSVPIISITADRPARFAFTGAPQCAEQVGLYGIYTPFQQDLASGQELDFSAWDQRTPAHLNVRLEEPETMAREMAAKFQLFDCPPPKKRPALECDYATLSLFLSQNRFPFVIVGSLLPWEKAAVKSFLLNLKAPVYLEAISGLREDQDLEPLSIRNSDQILKTASACNYPIDAVLRIGGIPTARLWRDLEELQNAIHVLSIASSPFSGLPEGRCIHTSLDAYFNTLDVAAFETSKWQAWKMADVSWSERFEALLKAEPHSEVSLVRNLSKLVPKDALIYLGNSLPIREWDLSASLDTSVNHVYANRGLNGIDGQVSTFMGLASTERSNWGIFGDLTFMYDLSAPAQLQQLEDIYLQLVVINNNGGQLFSRFFEQREFQCPHTHLMQPMAAMWRMDYELWKVIPEAVEELKKNRLIEIVPDLQASERFWEGYRAIRQQ